MSKLYSEVFVLKNLKRRGWLLRKACEYDGGRYESDAEHCYSMCMLAYEIATKEKLELDMEKVFKMILFHELGEIDAGDWTPVDNITKEEKYHKELNCISRISDEVGLDEIKSLWLEFEERKSKEAKFVKQIDELDAVMQSKIYSELNNQPKLYEEFYNYHKDNIDKNFLKYLD